MEELDGLIFLNPDRYNENNPDVRLGDSRRVSVGKCEGQAACCKGNGGGYRQSAGRKICRQCRSPRGSSAGMD